MQLELEKSGVKRSRVLSKEHKYEQFLKQQRLVHVPIAHMRCAQVSRSLRFHMAAMFARVSVSILSSLAYTQSNT